MTLIGKKILLGITGSIAAYKSATLARLLIKEGAEVKVVMTSASTEFISKLTMSVLTKHDVNTDIFSNGAWHNHVDLGLWADLMIIAPCTANTLGKMVNGLADNMLLATYLSAKCPVFFAPAMDLDMWKHPSTLSNLAKLKSYGNTMIDVGTGELASGLYGDGRMAEPELITAIVTNHFNKELDFLGKTILVTAGPTYEHLDPVRFIGNYSSGKMGIAIVDELANRGATVHLVLGPSNINPSNPKVKVYNVTSAIDMEAKVDQLFELCDVAILAAAVADYRPKDLSQQKIKKAGESLTIELIKNPDIAKKLGAVKKAHQITIGFALETNNAIDNAKGKIQRKNLDFIVLNNLQDKGAGFGVDTNKVTFIDNKGGIKEFELKQKSEVATDIADAILNLL